MAFFNGSGGAGDATTDSTSQAIAATEAAAQAAVSASQASTSATNAASSASAAATSATNALASANTATTQAAASATSANASALSATESTNQATLAAASASAAATSASTATGAADLAEDWAIKTSSAVSGGEYSAKYHANAAATSASNAATSASNAATSAADAAQSAIDAAAVIPSQTGNAGKFLTTDGTDTSWATVTSGSGTVTSVGLSAPTGLTVSGSPVTSSGTLALTYTSGYAIPTTAKQTEWDTAYGWGNHASAGYLSSSSVIDNLSDVVITSPSNGQVLKYNGTNWVNDTDATGGGGGGSGTVTSVAMTVPTGLSISGSPITTSGTLALTYTSGYAIPTTASQANWDTAYGWGNHASAGYLTSSAIGTTVQAYDADLTSWAAITPSSKQDTLVSGTNIKTINGTSVLGSGNITITGGSGDVIGPSSSTDNAIARFDGTTGKLIQNSAVTIDDTTGSMTFTGSGARIIGDFSNSTISNRTLFQSSSTNSNSSVGIIPNGTASIANFRAYGSSDPTNSSYLGFNGRGATNHAIESSATGTGTVLPIVFTVGGNAALTIRTDKGVLFAGAIDETVFAVSGTTPALSPSNGTIQTWTLSGNSTPTAGTWNDGESLTLMVNDGTAFTITWTSVSVTWVGGSAPTLATTGFTVIELWRVGGVIYGALVGSVA